MAEKFDAKKDKGFGILFITLSALILGVSIVFPLLKKPADCTGIIVSGSITIFVIGLIIWIWISTYYIIDENRLKIKSGPFKWTILIEEIRSVRLNQNTIGGLIKPTLSWKSVEVKYRKNQSVFITPENQDRFISMLKEKNSLIEVKNL